MTLRKGLLVAVAFVLCAVPASAADISVNGGFETGDFTGWQLFETQVGNTTIVSPGASGNFAACIDNTLGTSGSVIKNNNVGVGVVPPGTEVTINFDARGVGEVGGVAFAEFFSEIDGGGVSSSVLLGGAPLGLNADPDVWTSFSFTTTTGPDVSGGVTLQFAAVTGAAAGSTMFLCVDNVEIILDDSVANESVNFSTVKGSF